MRMTSYVPSLVLHMKSQVRLASQGIKNEQKEINHIPWVDPSASLAFRFNDTLLVTRPMAGPESAPFALPTDNTVFPVFVL